MYVRTRTNTLIDQIRTSHTRKPNNGGQHRRHHRVVVSTAQPRSIPISSAAVSSVSASSTAAAMTAPTSSTDGRRSSARTLAPAISEATRLVNLARSFSNATSSFRRACFFFLLMARGVGGGVALSVLLLRRRPSLDWVLLLRSLAMARTSSSSVLGV